jgi:hypothetical protein
VAVDRDRNRKYLHLTDPGELGGEPDKGDVDGDSRDNPVRSRLEVGPQEAENVLVNPLQRPICEEKQLIWILVHRHEMGWLPPRQEAFHRQSTESTRSQDPIDPSSHRAPSALVLPQIEAR